MNQLAAVSGRSPRRRVLQGMAACMLAWGGWVLGAPARAQSPTEQVFELRIEGGKIAGGGGGKTLRVTQGDVVELRWRSDEPVEIHLHGYDHRVDVAPGAPASLRFEARATGRFPVTRHAVHGHGHATLLYLEVHPR